MCLAVPSLVVAVVDAFATVEAFGQRRKVSLLLLEGPVQPGDYVLVQSGGYAFERIDAQAARESLALMQEIFAQNGADRIAW
jgi:hydrogenase expression/formation protein HypC